MKNKLLTRIILILLAVILVALAIASLFGAEENRSYLPWLLVLLAVVCYIYFMMFVGGGKRNEKLKKIEGAYASRLDGVFAAQPAKRKKLLLVLLSMQEGVNPKTAKQLENLKISAETNRDRAALSFFLGAVYARLGDTDNAEKQYLAATIADTTYAPAYSNLGVLYQVKERYGEAEKYLWHAIELDPKDPIKHSNIANLYLMMKDAEHAKEEAKIAIAAQPKLKEAHIVMALASALEGDRVNSSRYARRCIELGIDESHIKHLVSALLAGNTRVLRAVDNRQNTETES